MLAWGLSFESYEAIRKLGSSSGKEVLTSHSHRGFSPVIQAVNKVGGTVSTVYLPEFLSSRRLQVGASVELQQKNARKKVDPQRRKPLKRFPVFYRAQITGLKPRCE